MSRTFHIDTESIKATIEELIHYSQIVTVRAHTAPDMNKTGNPYYGLIYKDSEVNGIIHWNYSSSVNRQRIREELMPDFVAKPRTWGVRLEDSPFVYHKNKQGEERYYIEVKPERRLTEVYRKIKNNEEVPREELQQWLKKPYDPSEYQGVDKGVYLRDYFLGNLREIRMCGNIYLVDHHTELVEVKHVHEKILV